MRRALNALYDSAAAVAALCMVALVGMVMLGIAGRAAGSHLPGTDAYAGFLMAAAGFLALAHTLKRGEHIRVTLLLSALRPGPRRALELWSLAAASGLAGLLAFYSARLVWQSHAFNDISTGTAATPLWLPQLAMAAGTSVLLVALLDELVLEWRGLRARPATGGVQRHE